MFLKIFLSKAAKLRTTVYFARNAVLGLLIELDDFNIQVPAAVRAARARGKPV